MSNFYCQVKAKKTGKIYKAQALDDYFGKHKYGYMCQTGKHQHDIYIFSEEEVEFIKK